MGRHLAEGDEDGGVASGAIDLVPRQGRHALPDEPPFDAPDMQVDVHETPSDPVAKESGTRADLRLLREHSAVRAQCIAGVLASLTLYIVALVVIGRAAAYLEWIWIPIVLSGVLVGTFLDLGHRAARRRCDLDTEVASQRSAGV